MSTISVPFTFSEGSLLSTDDPDKIARQQILDVLMTDKFERVMYPNYGAATRRMLFDNVDSLSVADYRDTAQDGLNRHLTNCQVVSLNVHNAPPTQRARAMGGNDSSSTLYVTALYRLNSDPTVTKSVSVNIADPSRLTQFTRF